MRWINNSATTTINNSVITGSTISASTITGNTISADTYTYKIDDLPTTFNDVLNRLAALEHDRRFTYTELSCRNCGGKIEQKIDDYIVRCPYCKTVYIVGREQINDKG